MVGTGLVKYPSFFIQSAMTCCTVGLLQVVVEKSSSQTQNKFLPNKEDSLSSTSRVARNILEEVINFPRKRSLDKKRQIERLFYD